jgi:hypothetical protein
MHVRLASSQCRSDDASLAQSRYIFSRVESRKAAFARCKYKPYNARMLAYTDVVSSGQDEEDDRRE